MGNPIKVSGSYSGKETNYTKATLGNNKNNISLDTNKFIGANFNKNNFSLSAGYNLETNNRGAQVKFSFNKGGLAKKKGKK